MEQKREKSTVPCITRQMESCILGKPIDDVWEHFGSFKLEELAPAIVKSTKFESGQSNQTGSVVKFEFVDGSSWKYRITEISEVRHTLAYEIIATEPASTVTSMMGELQF